MAPTLSLRRYRSADRERVLELHEAALRAVDTYVEGVPEPDLRNIERAYLDEGGEFLVGEVDGQIVAMGAFRPAEGYVTEFLDGLPPSTAEIKRMRVDPDHQRVGYGQRVYDELERRARGDGYTEFVLDTSPSQVGARRFYEQNGYQAVDRTLVSVDDRSFELVFYRKSVGDGVE